MRRPEQGAGTLEAELRALDKSTESLFDLAPNYEQFSKKAGDEAPSRAMTIMSDSTKSERGIKRKSPTSGLAVRW